MNLNQQPGIYQIINIRNNRSYIGQAKNLTNRCARHRLLLRRNLHPNKYLQRSWNKHGESSFEFRRIINLPLDKTILKQAEQYWCNYFRSLDGVYNLRIVTESNLGLKRIGGMTGKKHSLETRLKMSSWQIGRKMSEESKAKMSRAKTGKIYWAKGRKHTETTRVKISQVQLKPVESICPETGIVIEYRSALEAVSTGLYTSSGISECLNGRIKKHRRLYWNFLR